MDESFGAFCRRVQAIQESHGWKFAPGLTEAAMDAWQARIGFVFPPEMREMLSIGYPVAARNEQMRSVGPVRRQSDGKIILRVRKRHIMIPEWLARRRPFREATFVHWSFVDWATTTAANGDITNPGAPIVALVVLIIPGSFSSSCSSLRGRYAGSSDDRRTGDKVNRWAWLLFMALGVFFFLAARPIAVRTINSYSRMSPEKKARTIPAQTTANRIGGIVFVVLAIVGLFKPTFMR